MKSTTLPSSFPAPPHTHASAGLHSTYLLGAAPSSDPRWQLQSVRAGQGLHTGRTTDQDSTRVLNYECKTTCAHSNHRKGQHRERTKAGAAAGIAAEGAGDADKPLGVTPPSPEASGGCKGDVGMPPNDDSDMLERMPKTSVRPGRLTDAPKETHGQERQPTEAQGNTTIHT